MNSKILCIFLYTFLFILLTFDLSYTQNENLKPTFYVRVVVTADYNIENRIKSYINRELRSLGDVIITDTDPNYEINIVALIEKTVSGYESGLAFSVVFTRPINTNIFNLLLFGELDEDKLNSIKDVTKDYVEVISHFIQVGSKNDMRNICDSIVAKFDSEHLELSREFMNKFEKIMDEKTQE